VRKLVRVPRQSLEARVAELERLVADVRARRDYRHVRDEADRALFVELADVIGDEQFNVGHVIVVPRLRDAMMAADVETRRDLGFWLRRLRGTAIAGVRLVRHNDRHGRPWQFEAC
jgi:hypothetical protein